jgi:polysaccharide export outer membrane protein
MIAQPLSPDSDYKIGPLDVVDVSVLHAPEITLTARVSGSGQITLPMIGYVVANGLTTAQLQDLIATRLRQYLKDPQVTVFVREYASQRVTVEGEVNLPGIFPIQGKTTLLQALALAHGTTQIAKLEDVAIYRTTLDRQVVAIFNLRAIRKGDRADPEIYGNDIVEVNQSRRKALYRDLLSTVPLATLIRP